MQRRVVHETELPCATGPDSSAVIIRTKDLGISTGEGEVSDETVVRVRIKFMSFPEPEVIDRRIGKDLVVTQSGPRVLVGDSLGQQVFHIDACDCANATVKDVDAVQNKVANVKVSNRGISRRIESDGESVRAIDRLSTRHLDVGSVLQDNKISALVWVSVGLELGCRSAENSERNTRAEECCTQTAALRIMECHGYVGPSVNGGLIELTPARGKR